MTTEEQIEVIRKIAGEIVQMVGCGRAVFLFSAACWGRWFGFSSWPPPSPFHQPETEGF